MTTLMRLALAWLIGVALAQVLTPPGRLLAAAVVAVVGLLVLWRDRRAARQALGATLVLLLGVGRALLAVPELGPEHIASRNDRGTTVLRGLIAHEPDRRDRGTSYRVAVAAVREGRRWRDAHGLVLVRAPRFPRHPYGATVRVTGTLETPPVLEDFDYRAYLARKGVHSVADRARVTVVATGGGNPVRRLLLGLKNRGRRALAAGLPEPEAALATGILLGDARGIPEDVDEAFRLTNTTHVIAISGSNISLLVVALMVLLGPTIGQRRAVPLVLLTLAGYTALVGADAAVVRAAVMGGLMVFGVLVGRPGHTATALLAAAWAMTAYRPAYLLDLGFQLSFAATLGLVLFSHRFGRGVEGWLAARTDERRARWLVGLANEAVLVTLAAQLTTWPLIAYHVGQVSIAGLVANALILPAQPALMGLGALTALVGGVWLPAARLCGALAWLPTAYTIRAVEWVAGWPLASVDLALSLPALALYYALLAVAAGEPRRWLARLRARVAEIGPDGLPWLAPLAAGALCVLTWVGALSQPDRRLHLHVLDVGQGDALLVVTPFGRRMLVDGGPSPSAVLDGLGRRLAPWDRRLDVVVLTHPDADHVGGLASVLARYRADWVLEPGAAHDTSEASAFAHAVAAEGAVHHLARAGDRLVLDAAAGVWAEVLWPTEDADVGDEPVNNRSVVLRLGYGAVTLLLTGDIEAEVEAALVERGTPLRADVLKLAHHGSDTSTSPRFLQAVRPRAALVSVGVENRFGHPSPEVLGRLDGIPVWRTDIDGRIEVVTDGRAVWVR